MPHAIAYAPEAGSAAYVEMSSAPPAVAEETSGEAIARALRATMAAAGHDLMQPVQIISHALERLIVAEQQTGDQVWLEAARTQVHRLARGLAELVEAAVSRDASPQSAVHCLSVVMKETEAAWARSAAAGGVRLDFTHLPASVGTDRRRLRSILDNLIGNALKYGRSHVIVSARRTGGTVCIDVVNDGDAIPAEVQARLFEAFYQADRTSEGLGLGLSIVREHCLALGHRIEVASERSGTRFTVLIDSPIPS